MEVRIILYPMDVCNDLKKRRRKNKVLRVKTRNKEQGTRNKVFPCLTNKEQGVPLFKGAVYITSSAPECIFF
jgi:hypothetical protein